MSLLTPSDIQHSAATQIWGCYRLVSEPGYREPAVMSSASSVVTYTSIYTSEPGRVFWGADDEEITDGGIPRVIERLARCTTPSTHSSPPPVPSPLLPSSGCPTQTQTLRMASTQALVDAVTAALLSPPLPPLLPSLYTPPPVDRRDDLLESELPPRKRLCLSTLGSRYEVGESSTARPTRDRGIDYGFVSTVDAEARRHGISEVGYGIRDTWVDPAEAVPEIAPMTLGEDAQEGMTRISQRVTIDSQRVDLLMEDKTAHQETIQIVEEEAYASREAWAHSIGLSQATYQELQTQRDHAYAYETHI
ncbi:hypothetical protein Tco_1347420 [Tanacetum coccineum]